MKGFGTRLNVAGLGKKGRGRPGGGTPPLPPPAHVAAVLAVPVVNQDKSVSLACNDVGADLYRWFRDSVEIGTSTEPLFIDTGTIPAPPPPGGATPLFADSFDSGSRAADQNGAGWQQTGSSRITTVEAYDGTHSLEFTYLATPLGIDSIEEERFNVPQLRDVWIRFQFYLPPNFVHRYDPPTNNKFLRLWGDNDNYGNNDPKCGLSFDHISGRSDLYLQWGDGTRAINGQVGDPALHWSDAFSAARRGQWHEFLLHARLSSAADVADGVFECWMFGEQRSSGPIVWWGSNADNYFATGYLMGHSNSGYDETTTFRVDEFRIFTSDPR